MTEIPRQHTHDRRAFAGALAMSVWGGLTVRLLVACTSSRSAELLWLASPRVCDEEGPVVRDELLLELKGLCRVLVLCRVGDNGFADGLADGVDLRRVTTACDADADVDVGECSGLEDEELPRASRSL